MDSSGAYQEILTNYEIENVIEKLSLIQIKEYGSPQWFKQDHNLQKLNIQAHLFAKMKTDQQIMESCVTFEKIKLLVYDLIMSEMWKKNVLPLIRGSFNKNSTFRSYIAIQHEAIVCNLLEVVFYHRTAVEAAENYILEIIDYCYRKLTDLIQKPPIKQKKRDIKEYLNKTQENEIDEQMDTINFSIQMMSLAIIRYITDHIKYLPFYVIHALLVEKDLFQVLIPLIETKPWMRESDGKREIFENSKWNFVEKQNYSKLPIIEAQVWIALFNLLMNPECRKKYELNDFKKNNLLRLRKYMNELLLDQIPNLSDMLRTLEELQIMNVQPQSNSNPFIVQQIPELRQQICQSKDWNEIAQYQIANFFTKNDDTIKEDIKLMADLYGNGIFEGLVEGFKCENCTQSASKRCSKCKQVWYCSRECQVANWKIHKEKCIKNVPKEEKLVREDPSKDKILEINQKEAEEQEAKIIEEISNMNFDELD